MHTAFTIEDFVMTTKNDIIRLRIQATLGNVEAMYELGYNYLYGIGTEVDIKKAHKYLKKAASNDFTAAKRLLTNVFTDNGLSTDINVDFKEKGYGKLKNICQNADNGIPEDLYLRAIGKLSDDIDNYSFLRAVNDLKKACQQEYAPALFALGRIYHLGKRIVGKESEGLSMIQKSVEKEFIPAIQYMMTVNPESVYHVIKRMAEKENAEGDVFCMLAQYYQEGIVVKKDIAKAISYYERSAQQGNTNSMLELGWIFEQSDDCLHDYQRAFELYSKASELNNSGAINNLGTC